MSAFVEYRQFASATANTYYTLWETYCTSPSYGTQAKKSRLPDMYPMDWNYNGAKRLVNNLKTQHITQKQNAKRDSEESTIRRQYSRQLFNHALKEMTENSTPNVKKKTERPKTTGLTTSRYDSVSADSQNCSTSGPTRHGSPLYNKRADLLNRIRVKTASARLNSDAEMKVSDNQTRIMKTIKDSNQVYKLVCNRFVEKAAFSETAPPEINIICSADSEPSVLSDKVNNEENSIRLSTAAPEEQTNLEEAPDPNNSVEDSTSGAQQKEEKGQALLSISQSQRPVSARSSRGSVSGYSDISVAAPRPRTWVDDVSVSSKSDTNSRGERPDTAKSRNQSDTNRMAAIEADVPILAEPPTKGELLEEAASNGENEPQLPQFICPSSEDKSREYAVRLWLATANFDQAPKTVPLA